MLRSEDYTEQDWAQLGRMFTNEFKPALQKWCSAYRGHISIRPEDLKLENFRGQLGVRTSPSSLATRPSLLENETEMRLSFR
jgi:hypothetical protein